MKNSPSSEPKLMIDHKRRNLAFNKVCRRILSDYPESIHRIARDLLGLIPNDEPLDETSIGKYIAKITLCSMAILEVGRSDEKQILN